MQVLIDIFNFCVNFSVINQLYNLNDLYSFAKVFTCNDKKSQEQYT